jgi:3-dehydroquinate synthase
VAAQEKDRTLNGLGYPVIVADSAGEPLAAFLRERDDRFAVVCDAAVREMAERLTKSRRRLCVLPFSLGEHRKRLATVENVLDALAAAGADRETLVVGVGGGVASDLFGLSASLYMRGVPYAHVATSLVAMVDAAIGGKTGVDLRAGKNLVGTFRDPVAVFAYTGALRTLPFRHLREGLGEMVKHAIIEGGDVFESLETLAPHPFWRWPWETVVADSIAVKTMIVREDREERGARELLNLGHTFAHGIEAASNYRVSHGAAVSIGLRAAGLLALATGRFSRDDHLRVLTLLTLLRLPVATRESPVRVFAAMGADKKKRGGKLRFVLPRAIGDVENGVVVSDSSVLRVLRRITQPPGGDEFR